MKLKNEVLVGIVVIAGLVVMMVGGWWLTGRPWGSEQREIVAAFHRVGLLAEGSQVKYRGVPVGRVETIKLSESGIGVLVTMSIEPQVQLPPDPAVVVAAESFFGDWVASIVSRGQPEYGELEFAVIPGAKVLPGAALPDITELTAVAARIADDLQILSDRVSLAFTEETAVQIRTTVENVADISAQLEGFIDQQTDTYGQVSRNILSTTAEVRAVIGQL
nr:MlaD family protein [Gemmatimonadota bacterium]